MTYTSNWSIRPILRLEYRAWLQHLHRVPCPKRYLHPILPLSGTQPHPIPLKHIRLHAIGNHRSAVPHHRTAAVLIRLQVIEHYIHAPMQTNCCLARLQMPMYRHPRPHLQGIQHPLRRVIGSRPEVIVHPQSLRVSSTQMQCRQQIIINFNYFHLFNFDVKAHTPFAPPQTPQHNRIPIVHLSRQPVQRYTPPNEGEDKGASLRDT